MRVYKLIFFVLLVFVSCTHQAKQSHPFSKEDQKDIENILNYFLFDHHAVFVLFGSKPMASVILRPPMMFSNAGKHGKNID